MSSVHEKMLDLINRCDICLDGNVISKELLTKSYYQFLSYTIEKESIILNLFCTQVRIVLMQ